MVKTKKRWPIILPSDTFKDVNLFKVNKTWTFYTKVNRYGSFSSENCGFQQDSKGIVEQTSIICHSSIICLTRALKLAPGDRVSLQLHWKSQLPQFLGCEVHHLASFCNIMTTWIIFFSVEIECEKRMYVVPSWRHPLDQASQNSSRDEEGSVQVLSLTEELEQLIAAEAGRHILLWRCSHWKFFCSPVDSPTPMYMWVSLIELSGLP